VKGLDVWAQIWPNPHPDGKVHESVRKGILKTIAMDARFEDIIRMVSVSPITDESDQLATARAIRDDLRAMRTKAVTEQMPQIG
jgi:hypothetical protein